MPLSLNAETSSTRVGSRSRTTAFVTATPSSSGSL
jgi:hypothetical protein